MGAPTPMVFKGRFLTIPFTEWRRIPQKLQTGTGFTVTNAEASSAHEVRSHQVITTHPLTTARTSIARFPVTVPVASSLLLAGPIGLLCDLGLFGLPSLVRDLCLPFSTTSRLGARTTVSESGSDAFNTLINVFFRVLEARDSLSLLQLTKHQLLSTCLYERLLVVLFWTTSDLGRTLPISLWPQ